MTKEEIKQKIAETLHWTPYCLKCTSMNRMRLEGEVLRCENCNNKIDLSVADHIENLANDLFEEHFGVKRDK